MANPVIRVMQRWKRVACKQAVSAAEKVLIRTYSNPEGRWSQRLTRRVARYRAFFRSQISLPNYPTYLYEGCSGADGAPLRALVRVDAHSRAYIPWLLYGCNEPTRVEAPIPSEEAYLEYQQQMRGEVDLIISTVHRSAPSPRCDGDWLRIPDTVRMVMDFAPGDTWEEKEKQLRHSRQRYNLSLVKRNNYHLRTTTDPKDYEFFVERMYLPTISERHGSHATFSEREWLDSQFAQGYVGQVLDGEGNWVAGVLCRDCGSVHFDLVLGVLDGREDLLARGAVAGMYVLSIRSCLERGMRRLDAGPNIPFLEDGVVKHKLKWGFKPVVDPWGRVDWLFWSPRSTPAALQWFDTHPTIPEVTRRGGPHSGCAEKTQAVEGQLQQEMA